MDDLFGLPAHPLLVHAAVVLVPLAALGAVIIALWPRARRTFGIVVVVLAFGGLVFSWLASESGESLEERVDETELVEEHAELGETMPLFAFALFAFSGGLVAVDLVAHRRTRDGGEPAPWMKPATIALAALTVLSAVVGTYEVALVGHSGAKATWDDVESEGDVDGGGGSEADHDDAGETEEGLAR
jgi:uncharacterized membrane protein